MDVEWGAPFVAAVEIKSLLIVYLITRFYCGRKQKVGNNGLSGTIHIKVKGHHYKSQNHNLFKDHHY
jgi:hypothetical protein